LGNLSQTAYELLISEVRSTKELITMNDLNLITCIVQRGRAEKVVDAALKAGAPGATYFYGRGTGVRQKLGVLSKLIVPEKEIIQIVTKASQTDQVFEAIIKAGKLDKKGQGFAYIHKIDRAIGFLEDY
jgi:nitrogen regulatory protein P-II 1